MFHLTLYHLLFDADYLERGIISNFLTIDTQKLFFKWNVAQFWFSDGSSIHKHKHHSIQKRNRIIFRENGIRGFVKVKNLQTDEGIDLSDRETV